MNPGPPEGTRREALRVATWTHPCSGRPQTPPDVEESAEARHQRESRTRYFEIVILTFTCGVLTLLVQSALYLGRLWIDGNLWAGVRP